MGGKPSKRQSNCHYQSPHVVRPSLPAPSRHSPYNGSNVQQPETRSRTSSNSTRYSKIDGNYTSLEQVTKALAQAGLESSNLIVGIDFTKSNEWTGARSFNRKCLHDIGNSLNLYEQAISIIGRSLSAFDEDNLIPCYGFGDASTHDKHVFSFYPNDKPCNGFEEALMRYREIVPQLRLAGPTSFAPVIEMAIGIVEKSGGQYHVLLIIADGQVTRSVDTENGRLSPQEQDTISAIVKASDYPLSIVLVGVGDGPWGMMRLFDDNIPARAFDNFQFVNFTDIMLHDTPMFRKETEFALAALMEIPQQYKATLELQLLGRRRGTSGRTALPPPVKNFNSANFTSSFSQSNSFKQTSACNQCASAPPENLSNEKEASDANATCFYQACPVCLSSTKDLVFGCGHQTCYDCGKELSLCPICRTLIGTRIRLYE
ncbi:hypothetical protein IFM89_007038 [Coptis chinensis]|uniref:RING-type domain-containing protein n=1 Tax=Coptis chinensis TaxID=261450 RepID=A0A835M4M2_9MAGN|nr:hypothetical protein IFM89_007038 [Coptis chinensis]